MLGAKNTGKSTVIRQMKKIAEAEYESDKDKEKMKNDIRQHTQETIVAIARAVEISHLMLDKDIFT